MSARWRHHFTLLDHGSAPVRNSVPLVCQVAFAPCSFRSPCWGSVGILGFQTLIVSGDHVSHGHLGFRLRYIGARSLIAYPYVFVAAPTNTMFFLV
jgi:hypothetical protein